MSNLKQQNKRSYSDTIPVDLFLNILSRLSLKAIARCRCVSKLWSSIIRRPNSNLLFPIKYFTPPKLLFTFNDGENLFFYSSPQNLDKNSFLVATLHHRTCGKNLKKLCRPVCGLVCGQYLQSNHLGNYTWVVISNPITGESVTAPKVTIKRIPSERIKGRAEYSFGYDAIDKQFKVLRITWFSRSPENWYPKYHVLTLGTIKEIFLWREIQCCTLHYPLGDSGICINGALFYLAMINNEKHTVVCFDVRYENFSFINIEQDLARKFERPLILMNYNGKLGVSDFNIKRSLSELWVLEDAEKHKWSKHIYEMPLEWLMNEAGFVPPARMISHGEVVSYPYYEREFINTFHYNLERKIITKGRLDIPEFKEFSNSRVYTFSNFVDDLMLI
ncbi:F-box domain [Arabidopsis suecica]|uniref:F-box domain n=1 Tax=Arabidopsis suecica TaxID=45249 RepID=A0A8T2CUH7_ARASU|nr:F-box domain [Arabidopsis suecica]